MIYINNFIFSAISVYYYLLEINYNQKIIIITIKNADLKIFIIFMIIN